MPKARLATGVEVHYQQLGEGPDLVLIHGLTGNLAAWHLRLVPLLWDRYRVTTYDLRGHGYSEVTRSGYTCGDMTEDLRALLDALGIQRCYIAGHSFGADIALNFALRYPSRVERVMAVEAALPALIQLRQREDWEGWAYWAEVLERSGCPVPPDKRADIHYMLRLSLDVPKKWGPLAGLPRNPKPFLRLLETTTLAVDYEVVGDLTLDNVGRIDTSVVLVYGERSAFLGSYEFLSTHLPNCSTVLLPRSEWGHFGPMEQPDLLAVELLALLDAAPELSQRCS